MDVNAKFVNQVEKEAGNIDLNHHYTLMVQDLIAKRGKPSQEDIEDENEQRKSVV